MLAFMVVSSLSYATPINNDVTADKTAARIMVYYGIGDDASPATSVTLSQFKAHMRELKEGHYNVVALPDLLKAYKKGADLPQNTILITFDGSEKSVLKQAAPLLKKYKFPFTVFLAPDRITSHNPRYLNKKDIKKLQKTPLVSFGIHPDHYRTTELHDVTTLRANINNAVSFYRDLFGNRPEYLSFPHGIYGAKHLEILKNYNFKAVFGQNSGVAFDNKKGSVLPRFVMTENYADMHRFKMTANALPLPAYDITPDSSAISSKSPAIGFTTTEDLAGHEQLHCFATDQPKPQIDRLGNRIEIRLKAPINDDRFRLNCTIPVTIDADKDDNVLIKWRWLGFLLTE